MSEVVKANGLTKSYGDFKALDDVNFTIEKGYGGFHTLGCTGGGRR